MDLTHRVAAGLLAGSLLFGGGGSVFAASKSHAAVRPGLAYGQVSQLTSTSFTLTRVTRKGQTTAATIAVTTTATTKERARKGTTGALADGEYALVVGAKSAAGIAATRVIYSARPFRAAKLAAVIRARFVHRAAGTVVTSAASTAGTLSSLTIQTRAGKSLTFTITTSTRFRVGGQLVTTAPTFTAGEKVRVAYVKDTATSTLVARAIGVPAAKS